MISYTCAKCNTELAKSRAKEFEEIAEKILSNALKEGSALEKLSMLIIQATTDFPPLQAFYTSMSNMRKSRAGEEKVDGLVADLQNAKVDVEYPDEPELTQGYSIITITFAGKEYKDVTDFIDAIQKRLSE